VFGRHFFGGHWFGPRYFGSGSDEPPPVLTSYVISVTVGVANLLAMVGNAQTALATGSANLSAVTGNAETSVQDGQADLTVEEI